MKRILAIVFALSLCISACKMPTDGNAQATVTTQQTPEQRIKHWLHSPSV